MFNKEVKEAKQANFKVTDKDGKFMIVRDVKLDDSKMKAVLIFAEKFTDKMEYTVESEGVIGADDKVMAKDSDKFSYMAAEVASIEFTDTTVPPGANLKDYLKVTDTLGRDVTKEVAVQYELDGIGSSLVDADGNIDSGASGQLLVVAKVKVGKNWVKSAQTTITISEVVAKEFIGFDLYTGAAPQAADTEAFMKLPEDKKVNFLNVKGGRKKVALYYKDQYGKSMPAVLNSAPVKPAFEDIMPTIAASDNVTSELVPISEGQAYFRVKYGKVQSSIMVTVRAEAKLAEIVPEETSVKMVEDPALGTKEIKVDYKDQFGAEYALPVALTVKAESDDETVAKVNPAMSTPFDKVTIVPVKKGTATVTVSAGAVKADIQVEVAEAGDLDGYLLVPVLKKLDLKDPATAETTINVFQRDKDNNPLQVLYPALNGTTRKLIAVDETGKPDPDSILVVDSAVHNKVKATDVGVGYITVQVDGYTEKKTILKIEVVHTGKQIKTIVLPAEIDFGTKDVNLDPATGIEMDKVYFRIFLS